MTSEGDTTQLLSREENAPEECQTDSKRKYRRISLTKRNLLLEKIFFENKKIKNAARELGINYSSAKTILHLYRKKAKKQNMQGQNEQKRCGYIVVRDALSAGTAAFSSASTAGGAPAPRAALNKIEIVVSQGGRNMCSISVSGAQQLQHARPQQPALHIQGAAANGIPTPLFSNLSAKLDARTAQTSALAAPRMSVNPYAQFTVPSVQQPTATTATTTSLDDSSLTAQSIVCQQQQKVMQHAQQAMFSQPQFPIACSPSTLFMQQMFQLQHAFLNAYGAPFMQQC